MLERLRLNFFGDAGAESILHRFSTFYRETEISFRFSDHLQNTQFHSKHCAHSKRTQGVHNIKLTEGTRRSEPEPATFLFDFVHFFGTALSRATWQFNVASPFPSFEEGW